MKHSTSALTIGQREHLVVARAFYTTHNRSLFKSGIESNMVWAVTLNMLRQPIDAGMLSALPPVAKMTDKLTPAQQLQSGCEALWSLTTAKYYNEASEQQRALMLAGMQTSAAREANTWRRGFGLAMLGRVKSKTDPKIVKWFSKKPVRRKLPKQSPRDKQAQALCIWGAAEAVRRGGAEALLLTVNLTTKVLNQNSAKKVTGRIEAVLQRLDPTARLEGTVEIGPKKGGVHAHFILFIDLSLSEAAVRKAIKAMPCVKTGRKAIDIDWVWDLHGAAHYLPKTFFNDGGRAIMRRIKK